MNHVFKWLRMNPQSEGFRINDYDWIGFDLDNTLVRYDPKYIINSTYDGTIAYLNEKKNYPQEIFSTLELEPRFTDFIRRGVVVDCETGNLMTVSSRGSIIKATHGTRELSPEEIAVIDPTSNPFSGVVNNPHQILFSTTKKVFLDFNTAPLPLIYAILIDYVEAEGITHATPMSVWRDVVESYEGFMGLSAPLNTQYGLPQRFIYRWGSNVLNWLEQLKTNKKTFLVSNSPSDWVSVAASIAVGSNWRDYFDLVVCSAMKPMFFMRPTPFLNNEAEEIEMLEVGGMYHRGSWEYMHRELVRLGGAKALYIGDNIMLDIFSSRKSSDLEKVAIIEELGAEGMYPASTEHPFSEYLKSDFWGSLLGHDFNTLWGDIIQKHAKFCVPSLDELAVLGLDTTTKPFWVRDNTEAQLS